MLTEQHALRHRLASDSGSTPAKRVGDRWQLPVKDEAVAQSSPGFLYAWLLVALFVEYARPTNQLGFLAFPFFYSLVPMLLLLVQSFAPGLRPMHAIFSDRISKWLLFFVGTVFLSWGINAFDAIGSKFFEMMLGYIVLFFLVARIVTTEQRFRGVVVVLALAHFYLLAFNFNVLMNPSVRQYISGGTFLGDGNDFSLSMCILIPLMFEVGLSTGSRFKRVVAWAAVLLIVLAIIATQSRGGTLGIGAIMAYLWWRSPQKKAAAVAIALVACLVLLYAPSQYFDRIGAAAGGNLDGSAQGRLSAWSGALGMGARSPILGIGPGHFSAIWGKTAHSTYMLAFAELGLPGFVCVLMLVFGNIHSNIRTRRAILTGRDGGGPDRERTLRLLDMTNAAAVGFAVSGAFLSATYYPHMYVLTALLLSARTLATQVAAANSMTSDGRNEAAGAHTNESRGEPLKTFGINPDFRPRARQAMHPSPTAAPHSQNP